jgi:hypothetical protein
MDQRRFFVSQFPSADRRQRLQRRRRYHQPPRSAVLLE